MAIVVSACASELTHILRREDVNRMLDAISVLKNDISQYYDLYIKNTSLINTPWLYDGVAL